jgi:hypothetical protein
MIYVGIYIILFILFMGVLIKRSAIGYQDNNGFHFGDPKEKKELKKSA